MTVGALILGLLNGMTFGLLGVGVVLVYNANRFINLAQAQMGVLSAQILALLAVRWGWSWWESTAPCLLIGIAAAIGVDILIIRPLRERSSSAIALLLASIGIAQIFIGLSLLPGLQPNATKLVQLGYPLPFKVSWSIGDVVLNGANVLVAFLVPVVVVALTLFLRLTMLGKTVRAGSSNPDAARLCGVSTRRVSTVTWAIAGGLAALTAILQAPSQATFGSTSLGPELLLVGLGAAAAGAFTSIPLAMAGGIGIGVFQQEVLSITSNASAADVVVLAVILLLVLLRGRAIGRVFAAGGPVLRDLPPTRIPATLTHLFSDRRQRWVDRALACTIGLAIPWIPFMHHESRWFEISLILIYALISVSLSIAIGWAGQVSLGHFAIVGAGAFIGARLIAQGWALPFAMLAAGAVGALLIGIIGIPALRVPGLTLALTTLGLAVVGPEWLFRQSWFGSAAAFGLDVPAPRLFPGLGRLTAGWQIYYVCLATLLVAVLALQALRRSQAGRLIVAVRDNEAAAAAFGITPATVKLAALSLSGFVAGVAGVLWAVSWHSVVPDQFDPSISLALVALPVIGGVGSIPGAVAGGIVFQAGTVYVSPHVEGLLGSLGGNLGFVTLFGGLSLVGFLLQLPQGLAGKAREFRQQRLDKLALATPVAADEPAATPDTAPLGVDSICVRFGHMTALDNVSISVGNAEIVGLIGPNGAGKTTLLNAISGNVDIRSGSVTIAGTDVSGMPSELRAQFGLSRSFQAAKLFPGLTVLETVQVAMGKAAGAGLIASAAPFGLARRAEEVSRRTALEIVQRLGLEPWTDSLTAELSTGTRRICDLAAQVASQPKVLLLDEPTAGVAQRDAEAFGPLLGRIRDELDCSILLVEHDMPLLMGICDRIYVMVGGRVIATGTPAQIRQNPVVIASYLGQDPVAIERSGARVSSKRSGVT